MLTKGDSVRYGCLDSTGTLFKKMAFLIGPEFVAEACVAL